MTQWDQAPRRGDFESYRGRDERDARERDVRDRRLGEGRHFGPPGRARPDGRGADELESAPYSSEDHGGAYGQLTRGGSDVRGGGFGGANVGGWGQSGLTSQWGGGGYGPLYSGLEYGQDGGRFGAAGYAEGDFAPAHHDQHAASYRSWRDAQLSNHDRDYGHWRNEQARRYDEDYHSWRNERHSAFSKEFEGWRAGRGGQAAPPAPDASVIHGANPTLSKIAEGHEGRTLHADRKTHEDGDKH